MGSGRGVAVAVASVLVGAALILGLAWNRPEAPAKPSDEVDLAELSRLFRGHEVFFASYVLRDGAELHVSPSASSKVLKKEAKGTQLDASLTQGRWQKVCDGGIEGWMRTGDVGLDRP